MPPSGPREILGSAYSDCLVKVGDAEDLAQKLQALKDNQNQDRFKPEVLKNHVQRFDKKNIFKKIMELN